MLPRAVQAAWQLWILPCARAEAGQLGVTGTRRRRRAGASPRGHAPRRPQAPSAPKKLRGSPPRPAGPQQLCPSCGRGRTRPCLRCPSTGRSVRATGLKGHADTLPSPPPHGSQPQARQPGGRSRYFSPPGPPAIRGAPPERHLFGFEAPLEQTGNPTVDIPLLFYPSRCQTLAVATSTRQGRQSCFYLLMPPDNPVTSF